MAVGIPVAVKTVQDCLSNCSTGQVRGLSLQIIDMLNKLQPNSLVSIADLNLEGDDEDQINPFVQPAAKVALAAAIRKRGKPLKVNSVYRTVAQQYMLFRFGQQGKCGIGAVAKPGSSNHESGLALDIEDRPGWRSFLEAQRWMYIGDFDPMHFDYRGGGVTGALGTVGVKAFQKLWNKHNPGDPIEEDGQWGSETEKRLLKSPAAGFAQAPHVIADGINDEDSAVTQLQEDLKQLGLTLTVTGQFDAQTQTAVRKFQADHGLVPDGKVGPATRRRLKALLRENTPTVARVGAMPGSPSLEGIDVEKLSEAEKNGLAILSHLNLEQVSLVKNYLKLNRPNVIGPTTLAKFTEACQKGGFELSNKGVMAFKDKHKLGNAGALSGVIGPQTASVYFQELAKAARTAQLTGGERKINQAGLDLVKEFEGLHKKLPDGRIGSYQDIADVWTIGYGHTEGVFQGQIVSREQAEQFLKDDMAEFEKVVSDLAPANLSDNQFAALVSFTFNVGAGALASSTALRKLKAGDLPGAAQALLLFDKAMVNGRLQVVEGLRRRRLAEKRLFETP